MRLNVCLLAALLAVPVAEAAPNASQVGNAALGGAIGGLLGNQVGNGRGKTVATAAGAVTGVVIASGCKASAGTALGGLLGGLLGSQVGGGNGSNIAAGVGAGIGALLGSDCSPIEKSAKPEPLAAMAPFTLNGLELKPMSGFPREAFMGMPPIVTPNDALVAAKTVRQLADASAQARADGNPELAVLTMYWAKRISATTMGVLSASLRSIETNTGKTASVPPQGLVILPSFNDFRQNNTQALLDAEIEMFAANEYAASKGVMVADNGGFGAALGFLSSLSNTGTPATTPAPAQTPMAAPALPKGLVGLPLNVVVMLPDGTYALQSDDALTLYNPNSTPSTVPLTKLDFKVRTAALSLERRNAAPLMFAVNKADNEWVFGPYLNSSPSGKKISVLITSPNKLVDIYPSPKVVAYIGQDGAVENTPMSGERAYKTQPVFKYALDTLSEIERAKPMVDYQDACVQLGRGYYFTLDGQYAQLLQTVCMNGSFKDKNIMYARTFFVGEKGALIQTAESANQDKANQREMTKALTNGEAFSDVLALLPLVGNIEGGMRCMGDYSFAQQASIGNALMKTGVSATKLPPTMANNLAIAKLSGWTPPPADEWSFDRITNCVGAIPLLGYAGDAVKVVDKVGHHAWVNVLSDMSEARINKLRSVAEAFNAPSTMTSFFHGVGNAKALFPDNPKASGFAKGVYDAIMSGQAFTQASAGIIGQLTNAK